MTDALFKETRGLLANVHSIGTAMFFGLGPVLQSLCLEGVAKGTHGVAMLFARLSFLNLNHRTSWSVDGRFCKVLVGNEQI